MERLNQDHPYTAGLLASTVHGQPRERDIDAIPGSPPDLRRLPPGCSFAPRCPRRTAIVAGPYPSRASRSGPYGRMSVGDRSDRRPSIRRSSNRSIIISAGLADPLTRRDEIVAMLHKRASAPYLMLPRLLLAAPIGSSNEAIEVYRASVLGIGDGRTAHWIDFAGTNPQRLVLLGRQPVHPITGH
jgi:oligopeptide/dipeptide ABC transporter ATP-binding protein